jgi:hypothetical protein
MPTAPALVDCPAVVGTDDALWGCLDQWEKSPFPLLTLCPRGKHIDTSPARPSLFMVGLVKLRWMCCGDLVQYHV